MRSNTLRYFLFPCMLLSEGGFRNLSVLFPPMSFLQVLRPPLIPPWAEAHFSGCPTIEESETLERIGHYLKGYQDLTGLRGGDSIMASMAHDWIATGSEESRLEIQSKLKGKGFESLQSERERLVEAAVFMEMARDLEERDLELSKSYAQVEHLEKEFLDILGIESGDEGEDTLGTLTPPLVSERSTSNFMLPQRITCWFRLFFKRNPAEHPIFVASNREVLEDLLETVESAFKRSGNTLTTLQVPLFSFPKLDCLPTDTYRKLLEEVEKSKDTESCFQSLEDLLNAPRDTTLREKFAASAENLRQRVTNFLSKAGSAQLGETALTLTALENCTHDELWKSLDKKGYSAGQGANLPKSLPVFLCLG